MTARCAVVGQPIAHSLSPAMHRAAYVSLGLDWTYEAVEVRTGALAEHVHGLGSQWRGLSVTMPLKREAAELALSRTEDVAFLKVANTLVRVRDGWHADNTDVPGAQAALREAGVDDVATVRVLGGGATAASVVMAAHRLGARRVLLHVRDARRAGETEQVARDLGLDVQIIDLAAPAQEPVDLLVNTIPPAATSGRAHEFIGAARALFEVLYDPWPTELMSTAEHAGAALCTGLDLLAHQAALQVAAMTGHEVDPQVLRVAALSELAAR